MTKPTVGECAYIVADVLGYQIFPSCMVFTTATAYIVCVTSCGIRDEPTEMIVTYLQMSFSRVGGWKLECVIP